MPSSGSTAPVPKEEERGVVQHLISSAGRKRLLVVAALALVVLPGAMLAVGSFLGIYVRPTSDDWCGAWKTRDMGVFGITRDYYETQNGRVANAFLTGIVYSHGLLGQQVLPLILVLTLTAGLVLTLVTLGRRLGWRAPLPVVLAVVLVVEMLLFFAGTRPYQALLWAPGTISHTLPGIVAVWSGLLAVWAGRRGGRPARWGSLGYALVTGAVVGTLSEPFTVVSGVFLGAAAVVLLVPSMRRRVGSWYPFTWCAAWCVGLVVGFTVLYTSPGARWRREQTPSAASPLSDRQLHLEVHDWIRVWHSIGGTWSYLGALAVGLLLGLSVTGRPRPQNGTAAAAGAAADAPDESGPGAPRHPFGDLSRRWTWTLLALPVPLLGISSFGVVVGLRMGYGGRGWTYGRAWTNFLFPMLLLLVVYGVLIGRQAARRLTADSTAGWRLPALFAVGLASAATGIAAAVHLVPVVDHMTSSTVVRAQAWDRQNALIHRETENGATVVTYHPLVVPQLAEPFIVRSYAKDWAAACVAHYYDVTRIQKPPAPHSLAARQTVPQHKPRPKPKARPGQKPHHQQKQAAGGTGGH